MSTKEQTTDRNQLLNTKQQTMNKYENKKVAANSCGLEVVNGKLLFTFNIKKGGISLDLSSSGLKQSCQLVSPKIGREKTAYFIFNTVSLSYKPSDTSISKLLLTYISLEEYTDFMHILGRLICDISNVPDHVDGITEVLFNIADRPGENLKTFMSYIISAIDFNYTDIEKYIAVSANYYYIPFHLDFVSFTRARYLYDSIQRDHDYLTTDFVVANNIPTSTYLIMFKYYKGTYMSANDAYLYFSRLYDIDEKIEENFKELKFITLKQANFIDSWMQLIVDNNLPPEAYNNINKYVCDTSEHNGKPYVKLLHDVKWYQENLEINKYVYNNILNFTIDERKKCLELVVSNKFNDTVHRIPIKYTPAGKFKVPAKYNKLAKRSFSDMYNNRNIAPIIRKAFIEFWNSNYPMWKIDASKFCNLPIEDNSFNFYYEIYHIMYTLHKYPKLSLLYTIFSTEQDTGVRMFTRGFRIEKYKRFDYSKTNPREMMGLSKYAFKLLKEVQELEHYNKYLPEFIVSIDDIIEFGYTNQQIEYVLLQRAKLVFNDSAPIYMKDYIDYYEKYFNGIITKKAFTKMVIKIIEEIDASGKTGFHARNESPTYSYLSLYKDYIRMCKDMNIIPAIIKIGEKVRFPQVDPVSGETTIITMDKLTKYHDDLVSVYTATEEKWVTKGVSRQYDTHKKLQSIKLDGYTLLLAKDQLQIVEEGQALSHCVGSYVKRVASGDSLIAFFRDDKYIDTPLYTMEISTKGGKYECRQFKGFKNKAVPAECKSIALEMINIANR